MSTFDLDNPHPDPGDKLRDEAANLLSLTYGRPKIEYREGGKKADIFFEKTSHGRTTRHYCEAKDYNRPLGVSDLASILNEYSGITSKHKTAVILVITRRGITSDGQTYIQDQGMMCHQTIWELEDETMGLTAYVRALESLFDQEGLRSYYVPARAREAAYSPDGKARTLSPATDLFPLIEQWIDEEKNPQRPLAILGGYGAGKTSLAKLIVSSQAKKALGSFQARRPVLVRLGQFTKASNLELLLGSVFGQDGGGASFRFSNFMTFNEKGRFLIVLDGFDEMKHAMSYTEFRSQCHELNRLITCGSKVILLGRPSAFTSHEEHYFVLQGMGSHGKGWRRIPEWPQFAEYDLEEFTTSERSDFVRRYLRYEHQRLNSAPPGDEWIEARADEVNALADVDPEIFGKPVHAKILTDLALDPLVDLQEFSTSVSRWTLYNAFFTALTRREALKEARRPISDDARLSFLRDVAYWLWTGVGASTSFSAFMLPPELISGPSPEEISSNSKLREYLSGSFLEKKSGDVFYFPHRSFAEFLVAQRMALRPPSGSMHNEYSHLIKEGVEEFLRDAAGEHDINRWAGTLHQARGPICIEYIFFLGSLHEKGNAGLLKSIPPTSPWATLIPMLGEKATPTEITVDSSINLMRDPDNTVFFAAKWFYTMLSLDDAEEVLIDIAAALLDRVFCSAVVDSANGTASISHVYNEARSLAAHVLTATRDSWEDRFFVLHGGRLDQLEDEQSARSFSIISQGRPRFHIPATSHLGFSDVLERMAPKNATKAREYFAKRDALHKVFAKEVGRHVGARSRPRR